MRRAPVLGMAAALLCIGAQAAPDSAPCPAGLPDATRCLTGRDDAGAFYWIAVPPALNGVLVLCGKGCRWLQSSRTPNSRVASTNAPAWA